MPAVAPDISHSKVGYFWEDRGDRHHCGIDIYASEGNAVVSIADGQVVIIGLFATPAQVRYWNPTYHIIVQHKQNLYCRYAELVNCLVVAGQCVQAGQVIGHVGTVLNKKCIDDKTPTYIQELALKEKFSMLHLEALKRIPTETTFYQGGNLFSEREKEPWMDPMVVLKNVK